MADSIDIQDIEAIATETLAARDEGRQIQPFTGRYPNLDMAAAYRVCAALRHRRLR